MGIREGIKAAQEAYAREVGSGKIDRIVIHDADYELLAREVSNETRIELCEPIAQGVYEKGLMAAAGEAYRPTRLLRRYVVIDGTMVEGRSSAGRTSPR
jgi:hypothetical protein